MNSTENQYANQGFGTYRAGARVGGVVIAFQCIGFLIFIGGGLMLMGTIMTATTYTSQFDHTNSPFGIIGPVFLSIGGVCIIASCILCSVAHSTGKKLQSENPGGYIQQPIIAGATAGNMYLPHSYHPQQPPYPVQNPQQTPYSPQNVQEIPYQPQSYSPQPAYNPEDQNYAPPPYDISKGDTAVSNDLVKNC